MNTSSSSPLHSTPTTVTHRRGSDEPLPVVDATSRLHPTGQRALVLGGGGSTGNAWLIGVIAGLSDAGLDATTADLTIGTSAGATAAAQLAGATPAELFAAALAPVPQRPGAQAITDRRNSAKPVVDHMDRTARIIADSEDMADMRRRMGAAAIDMAEAMDGASARWRATVATRLPQQSWPERAVLLTAVDAQTGEPVVFDRDSGVELVDAVAASCASGFAYSIGNGRYIDGGYRSNAENADLAAGHARVLVLSPFGGQTRTPMEWRMHLAAQIDALRGSGSRVETVFPESDSEHMFGVNAMDLSLRPAAAQAGFDQGRALAGQLREFWQ
ncbi:patatin-like phospholipase family protein [Arthrobacter sp. 18067]|uniref:patatin-like phospholipase family protein n=1 Tax=Arthrobacter sp. 18067 TaxID=2681413 RepID=UPI001357C0B0|nr:patatin-like phospholipase family protein [Arthrobacter sp. 18067]